MVVKLKAYRLATGYREEFVFPILDGLTKFSSSNRVDFGSYTNAQIGQLDSDFGLLYRRIYSTQNGEQARIIEIDYVDRHFTTDIWTGAPVPFTLRVNRFNPVFPIIANKDEEIDVSELLLEDDIEIVRQIESLDKFDLRVSRATFSLDYSNELELFLDKYWNPDGYEGKEYLIGVEIEGYFWGFSDFDNINYDEVEKTYHFDSYDPVKWLQKNIWSQRIPSLGVATSDVENFLTKTCGLFVSEGKAINIEVEASQLWNRDYAGGYYGDYNPYFYTLDEHLTILDMIGEILKHYGAVIYFDYNGDLNFVGRSKKNPTAYNEDNMLEELNKSFQGKEYSGLLINVTSSGTNWSAEQWALVWEANGVFNSTIIDADLDNIPKNFSYLDLRQELPDKTFEYRVFHPRTQEEVYADYKELMRSSTLYETTLDGVDYKLYDTITIGGVEYTINYLQISFNSDVTKVRLYKSI